MTSDTAISLASVAALAQIDTVPTSAVEAWLKLGVTGILVAIVWRMFVRDEKRDKAEQEERERRDKLEQEREKALIDLVKSIHEDRRKDGDG